jgi:hypothetical protein
MQWIRKLPFSILIVATVFMLGAPFVPVPHLVEKARMLTHGTLNRPLDIFDVVWHLLPAALLVWKTALWRRDRAVDVAAEDLSPPDSTK